MLGTYYAIVYTKGRGEQSIDIQGENNTKRGGSGQGAAANAWGDHVTGSKSQSGCYLEGRVRSGSRDTWLVDKKKGGNFTLVVTSFVMPCVIASTNCYYNQTSGLSPRCTVLAFLV